jgi:hypothetical protein
MEDSDGDPMSSYLRGFGMSVVYGYIRLSKKALSLDEQKALISSYASSHGLTPGRELIYCGGDDHAALSQGFLERPLGRLLSERLHRGDCIVVSSLDRAFLQIRDCSVALGCLARRGVEFYAVDLGPDSVNELDPLVLAGALSEMERAARSERAVYRVSRLKCTPAPVNAHAPYGKKWIRRPGGKWELVTDEEELALMAALYRMHEQGVSIDRIRQYLAYEKRLRFYKQRGRKKRLLTWNPGAISRRIKAYERLLEQQVGSVAGASLTPSG